MPITKKNIVRFSIIRGFRISKFMNCNYSVRAGIILLFGFMFIFGVLAIPHQAQAIAQQDCWKDLLHSVPDRGDELIFIYQCCESVSKLTTNYCLTGIGSNCGPVDIGTRRYTCVDTCNKADPIMWQSEGWGKRFEELCCDFKTWNLIDPAPTDKLEKKCEEASVHTGTGMCSLKKDRPDALAADCCAEEKENTVQEGKACNITTFLTPDSCKPDGKFLCCLCVDPKDSSRSFYLPGSFNCRMCKKECQNRGASARIPNAVPDYEKLPYTEAACTQTAADFEGAATSTKQVAKQRRQEPLDMFCFTLAQCTKDSGSASNFKPGQGCPMKGNEKQGRCLAPEPDYRLQYPILGVSTIRGLRSYIGLMFKAIIGLIIVMSAVFFTWGAFKYIVSSVASTIQKSKEIMVDALVGLVLGFSAFTILSNINPYTLEIKKLNIDMINKMSFFNVVFCKDILPPTNVSEAGTVLEPKSYSESFKAGFKTKPEEAKCGYDYFIDGGDSTSICSGDKCEKGVCVSCAAGISTGCKTTSFREFACSDAQMAGTVVAPAGIDLVEIYAMALAQTNIKYDPVKNLQTANFDAWELDRYVFKEENTQKTSTGEAHGSVTGYRFNKLTKANLDKFIADRKSAGEEPEGLVLVLRTDPDWFPHDIYYVIATDECTGGLKLEYSYIKSMFNAVFNEPGTLAAFMNKYGPPSSYWAIADMQKMASYENVQKCDLRLPPNETIKDRFLYQAASAL